MTPSPVPVQDTLGPYLAFAPSVRTWVLLVVAVVSIGVYVTQVLRMPRGTFWKQNFRFAPFVSPLLGLGSMVAMVVAVAVVGVSSGFDQRAHQVAVDAQDAWEDAAQSEVRAALSDYYGVEFVDDYARIYSYRGRGYDSLPGQRFTLELADGTQRTDCYVGQVGDFYVISCGPKDAPQPLPPGPGKP